MFGNQGSRHPSYVDRDHEGPLRTHPYSSAWSLSLLVSLAAPFRGSVFLFQAVRVCVCVVRSVKACDACGGMLGFEPSIDRSIDEAPNHPGNRTRHAAYATHHQ